MTVFNLNGSEGVWFDLEDGGRVRFRTMDADALKAIQRQTVKRRVEYKRVEGKAERFVVEDVDEELQQALFWDHVIAEWDGILDAHQTPIPCDRDHKLLLLAKSPRFARFVSESLARLQEDDAARAEAEAKN